MNKMNIKRGKKEYSRFEFENRRGVPLNSKRSQGHVEMIVSFVIFIGFVLALLYLLNPLKENTLSYSKFSDAQDNIIKNLSIDYQSISLILNYDPDKKSCFSAANSPDFSKNIVVVDLKGNVKNAEIKNNEIKIARTSQNLFYRIYSSEEFSDILFSGGGSCDSLNPINYSYGVLTEEKVVLYENIENLNRFYLEDYNKLKSSLGISSDFDFSVYTLERKVLFNESRTAHKLITAGIISQDIPLKIINKTAAQIDAIFNLRVW